MICPLQLQGQIKTLELSINYPFPQFGLNNAYATFIIVYFCPQRQYKLCVNIGPFNVVVLSQGAAGVWSNSWQLRELWQLY